MKGWIKIHRDLYNHPIWIQEQFTRGQAWVDLILLAKFESGYVRKRGARITLFRGQLAWSQAELAIRWDWSRNKLRRFLKELEEDGMITVKRTNVSSTITIVNYEKWQGKEEQTEQTNEPPYRPYISRRENSFESNSDEPPNETAKGQQTNHQRDSKRTPFKKGKKVNNEKKEREKSTLKFFPSEECISHCKNLRQDVDVERCKDKFVKYYKNFSSQKACDKEFVEWVQREQKRVGDDIFDYNTDTQGFPMAYCTKCGDKDSYSNAELRESVSRCCGTRLSPQKINLQRA